MLEHPLAWKPMYKQFRGVKVKRFPYRVVYLPLAEEVHVYTIFDLRQDPARLVRRLDKAPE